MMTGGEGSMQPPLRAPPSDDSWVKGNRRKGGGKLPFGGRRGKIPLKKCSSPKLLKGGAETILGLRGGGRRKCFV